MLKLFLNSYIIICVSVTMGLCLVYGVRVGLTAGPILAIPFSLFATFLRVRNLKRQAKFQINTSNKDRNISMKQYFDEIHLYLLQIGYSYKKEGTEYTYTPRPIMQTMGGKVLVERDPLFIEISGPLGIVTILNETLKTPGVEFELERY